MDTSKGQEALKEPLRELASPSISTIAKGQPAPSAPTTVQIILKDDRSKDDSLLDDWKPAIPSVLAAMVSVWAVHKLTKGREREKAVYELYKTTSDHVASAKTAAILAWGVRRGTERQRAVAETKWRIQQVGSTVNRLRLLSRRRRWRLKWRCYPCEEINMETSMIAFRRALTQDPFEDPSRNGTSTLKEEIERAAGELLTSLDASFARWM